MTTRFKMALKAHMQQPWKHTSKAKREECKEEGCKNLKLDGSSRCHEHSKNYGKTEPVTPGGTTATVA